MRDDLQGLMDSDRADLVRTWTRLMNEAPPARLSAALMRRILAFEIQASEAGGLSRATKARLAGLASGTARPRSPRLLQGSRLMREWNGITHVVDVTGTGFLWQGRQYRSLSAIARAISGTNWSGPRFFGMARRSGS